MIEYVCDESRERSALMSHFKFPFRLDQLEPSMPSVGLIRSTHNQNYWNGKKCYFLAHPKFLYGVSLPVEGFSSHYISSMLRFVLLVHVLPVSIREREREGGREKYCLGLKYWACHLPCCRFLFSLLPRLFEDFDERTWISTLWTWFFVVSLSLTASFSKDLLASSSLITVREISHTSTTLRVSPVEKFLTLHDFIVAISQRLS